MVARDSPFAPLAGRSSTLFLLAGVAFVVFAASTGARAFTDAAYPTVHDVLGPAGFFLGAVGLFGLYPTLRDRTPTVARAAAVVTAIPAVGWFAIAAIGIGEAVSVLPDASVVLPGVAFIVVFLATILAYLLFGAATLRSGAHARAVGVLVLLPAVLILLLIAGMGVLREVVWGEFAIDAGHALAHLAIGIALRTAGGPTERAGAAPDSTA